MEIGGKPSQRYLTVNQISDYLNRSPGAIRNLVLRRAIPYRKPAGRLLFDRDEIDLWIRSAKGISLEDVLNERN